MSVALNSGNAERHPRASFERVIDALTTAAGPGKSGGGWVKFHCPVSSHGGGGGDRNPSLGVRYDPIKSRTRVECFSGCDDTAVLATAGLTIGDLFDEPPAPKRRRTGSSNGLVDLGHHRQPTTPTANPPPDPRSTKKPKAGLGRLVETYEYPNAAGDRVGRVLRYDPKDFRPQRWNPATRRWSFGGFGPLLYRLPEVVAAISAGEPVYLVEGEKDTNTAFRCGVVATTNASGGGNGKFLPEHAEQLRGAHIVLVADRDKAGYQHVIEAQERLQGIAASIRIVQAVEGKDLTDHTVAGHDIEELTPIDPVAKLAELAPEPPTQNDEADPGSPLPGAVDPPGSGPPPGGGGGFRGDQSVPNLLPRYLHRLGETVKVGGKPDEPSFTTVWRCEVSVLDQMIDDDGDPTTANTGGGWRLQLRRPIRELDGSVQLDETSEIVWEESEVELAADKVRDGTWHEDLPWPGLIHDLSTRGRTNALQAAMLVKPMPTVRGRRYTATGWREIDGKSVFVHASGGIGCDGDVDLPHISITGKLGVFQMPKPTQNVDVLRDAVRDGLAPLIHLPAAIVAPLIGFAFRSVFGNPRTSLHLVGEPGSGKTSITRCAGMHWFASDMRENGRSARKEVFSALEDTGESIKGLLNKMHQASDVPITVDDFKGPKGPTKLAALQSAIWNGGGRTLGTRTGGDITTGSPRCAVITTGETSSTGSSATRALTIRVNSHALLPDGGELTDLFGPLERQASREARGVLGASFIQWVAGRRSELTDWVDDLESESPYIEAWNRLCAELEHDSGVRGRIARVAMVCTSGWIALLTWLLQAGVLTREQADGIWDWVIVGLIEQIREQDPSSVDGPRHMLDLLRSALLTGTCHLSNQMGGVPEEIRSATTKDGGVPYGWSPRTSVTGGMAEAGFHRDEVIWQARGDRVGILTDHEVWLMPRTVLGVVSTIANRAGETFPHTSVSLGSAMAARGWITANGSGDRSANRRIAAVQQRVWVMPRQILDGIDDDPDSAHRPIGRPDIPTPPWQSAETAPPTGEPDDTEVAEDAEPAGEDPPIAEPVPTDDDTSEQEVVERRDETPVDTPVGVAATSAVDDQDQDQAAPRPVPDIASTPVGGTGQRRKSADNDPRWLAAAAVVTADELVLPDGTRIHLNPAVTHLGQLAELAADLRLGHGGGKYVLPSAGQLLLTTEGMARFGIVIDGDAAGMDADTASDAAEKAGEAAAAAAVAAGWNLSQDNALRVWTRIWRPRVDDRPSISAQVVLVPLMGAFDDAKTLTADDPTPPVLARRAQLIADTLGVTWGASGGVTGLNLLRNLRPPRATSERAPLAATDYVAPPPPMVRDPGRVPNTALLWCRAPDMAESTRAFVHAYDANAMYLAAAGATEVGVGAPEHHRDGTAFTPKVAGLWRIEPGATDDLRLPDITRPAGQFAGTTTWYPTPVIRYLSEELGDTPEILEAYTWPTSTRRYFDQWYKVVRDARAEMMAAAAAGDSDADVVLQAVKGIYKRTVGRFARVDDSRSKSPLYRPDWRLAIVSTANVNLLRKVRTAGLKGDMWPVAISTDEVFYLSDEQDPVAALPQPLKLGNGLGQFKVTRSAPLTDEIRKGLAGKTLSGLLPLVPKVTD